MMGGFDGFSGGMAFGGLGMLLFWGLIIVGAVLAVRWLAAGRLSTPESAAHGERALEILRERYAKGEIDQNEFEQKKRDLRR